MSLQYFDIIGFDPRGINASRPLLTCFPNHLEAAAHSIDEDAHGMIGTSDTSFDYLWASKRAVVEGCSRRAAEEVRCHVLKFPCPYRSSFIVGQVKEWSVTASGHSNSTLVALVDRSVVLLLSPFCWRSDLVRHDYMSVTPTRYASGRSVRGLGFLTISRLPLWCRWTIPSQTRALLWTTVVSWAGMCQRL